MNIKPDTVIAIYSMLEGQTFTMNNVTKTLPASSASVYDASMFDEIVESLKASINQWSDEFLPHHLAAAFQEPALKKLKLENGMALPKSPEHLETRVDSKIDDAVCKIDDAMCPDFSAQQEENNKEEEI
jgi:hypothetical protein